MAAETRIAPDGKQWARQGAELIQHLVEETTRSRGRCLLALSGGSTPKVLYEELAQEPWRSALDWSHVQFLFGDERCVPPDHPDSNFRMAAQALFTSIGIPPVQIHRMHGEERDPAAAAREYEAQLRTLAHCTPPTIPQLDIVLLGLGNDGHTASLFPETEALRDRHHLVAVGRAPNGVARRLTLTLAVINRANVVLFLVAGAGKAEMVRRILKGNTQADRHLPAALVKPEQGRLIWLLDESAAAHVAGSQSQP